MSDATGGSDGTEFDDGAVPVGPITYPRWLWVVGGVVVVVVALAIAGLVIVGSDDDVTGGQGAIQQLIPKRDSQIVQQQEVGVQLGPGFDGELAINGVPIPSTQLDRVEGLNIITFKPGPNKAIEQLRAGENCATVTYWRVDVGPDDADGFAWCFSVV